ncbi:hypothetical protein [Streptomyces sp. 5-6(2022)]|uniref:hypothetical protein n=1 Tax=Streptomyces sp. 5-6(2022) TaxID=2936510 RepID=UPI0023B9FBD9|nr:hypothetical protein [Streptomyces sp. 5-6(2022)]
MGNDRSGTGAETVSGPGYALLLAAGPAGKQRLMDAAAALPQLAAVPPAALLGTPGGASVVQLVDPVDPQTVLTHLRTAAAHPGPVLVHLAGQLTLDAKQRLPHLALARTTPRTARYTALPWHWLAAELGRRPPGSTVVVADLVADETAWPPLRTAGPSALAAGLTLYGTVAPTPPKRQTATPDYSRAFAGLLRAVAERPSLVLLHQRAVLEAGLGTGPELLLDGAESGEPYPTPDAAPGPEATPWPGQSTPRGATWQAGPAAEPAGLTGQAGLARQAGPVGQAGPTGAAGPSGPPEQAGATGQVEASGRAISAGQTGEIRPTGAAGQVWATGRTRAAGHPGPTGVAGLSGPTEQAGAAGASGRSISAGQAGEIRPTGAAGQVGATGQTRAAGHPGPTGVAGLSGPTEQAGAAGASGRSISAGQAGEIRPTGAAGQVGATGQTRAAGHPGPTGVAGLSGPIEQAGATGATGSSGQAGQAVWAGEAGAAGPVAVTPPPMPPGPPESFRPADPLPAPPSLHPPQPTHAPVPPPPGWAPVADPLASTHAAIFEAANAGRHSEAASMAAAWEQEALRTAGPRSDEAIHWLEVRADLSRIAGDPARACELWLAVADARLGNGEPAEHPEVEGAVDRAHHQWQFVADRARAGALAPLLIELRGRVPGRRPGALEAVRRRAELLRAPARTC